MSKTNRNQTISIIFFFETFFDFFFKFWTVLELYKYWNFDKKQGAEIFTTFFCPRSKNIGFRKKNQKRSRGHVDNLMSILDRYAKYNFNTIWIEILKTTRQAYQKGKKN